MKIAMIGQKGVPSRTGGIEIHVEEISKRLSKKGYDLNVYCRKGYCNETGSSVTGVRKYRGIRLKFTPYIKSKHLDAITHTFTSTIHALLTGCDVFHYHALGPSTLAFIPRIFGKKVVCTVHGLDWQRGKWGKFASWYLKFGEYATARFSNKTISVSQNLVQYYKDKYGVDVTYIPNGVEKVSVYSQKIIKEKYGLGKEEYFLFLARLVREKGIHYLIEAYKSLKTDKKLVIAGGASHSDEYVRELYELAAGDSNIVFTGFVEGRELGELFSNAYSYVLPSDIEGLPISLLEAMSYGVCCLTSDIEENKAVIGTHGFTFRAGDIEDLRLKLEYLIENQDIMRDVGKSAERYVQEKYNWATVAGQTDKLYVKLS